MILLFYKSYDSKLYKIYVLDNFSWFLYLGFYYLKDEEDEYSFVREN
ncbi:hypothetical protein [Candidatus Borreliella tachyglossi]|nr:hypothetical protein [Candidatus Borreliella tachyglossi]